MKFNEIFNSQSNHDRKLLSIWILWVLFNFCLMFILGHPTGKMSIWVSNDPYDSDYGGSTKIVQVDHYFYYPFGNKSIKYYDYTEFLFYSLLPLGLFCAKRVTYPRKTNFLSNFKIYFLKNIRIISTLFLLLIIVLVSLSAVRFYQKNRLKRQEEVEEKRIADSIYKSDSIIQVKNDSTIKSQEARYEFLKRNYCNEVVALAVFKEYMEFYYPQWKNKGKPKINKQQDCTYRISVVGVCSHDYYPSQNTLIAEINLNCYGRNLSYTVTFIDKPFCLY